MALSSSLPHVLSTSRGVHHDFMSVGDSRSVLPRGTRSCGQGRLGNRERERERERSRAGRRHKNLYGP